MNVLISSPTIQLIPTLAKKVGLNEAIVLQQLHFRMCISKNWRDGHRWVYKTYEEWRKEEFPFWSVDTIYRTIRKLEKEGYLISTDVYNRMHVDKTKWYRINYDLLDALTSQIAVSDSAQSETPVAQNEEAEGGSLRKPITKEVPNKTINKDLVENNLDVIAVIQYLNKKAKKQYRASSKAIIRLVKGRFQEGYELADFQSVIDVKVKEWYEKPKWEKYLRPSTLFNATNFENYLEESRQCQTPVKAQASSFTLDFSKGEF